MNLAFELVSILRVLRALALSTDDTLTAEKDRLVLPIVNNRLALHTFDLVGEVSFHLKSD